MSLLTLHFPEEIDEYETSIEILDMIDGVIMHDKYSDEMFMVDMSQITDTPGLLTDVTHDDDVFEGVISSVVVEFEHVDPSLSFDVLSGFVSHSDDVLALSSYMDITFFEYFSISCDIILSAPHSPTS